MTEKRFRHMRNKLGMQFIGYDEKYVLLGTFADAEGVNYIVDLLNDLNDENKHIKNTIKEAYETERTDLGKSVLKQLLEQL